MFEDALPGVASTAILHFAAIYPWKHNVKATVLDV